MKYQRYEKSNVTLPHCKLLRTFSINTGMYVFVHIYIHDVPIAMYVLLNWAHISKIAQTIDSNESMFSMQLQLFRQHHRCSNVKRILERIYAIWAHYLNRADFTVFLLTCLTYFELVKSIYTSLERLTCNCTFYKLKMLFTLSTQQFACF